MNNDQKKTVKILCLILGAIFVMGFLIYQLFFKVSNEEVIVTLDNQSNDSLPAPTAMVTPSAVQKTIEQDDQAPVFLDESVREAIANIADSYAENSKYPIFSQPVLDQQDAIPPAPFEEAQVDQQLPEEDGSLSPIKLSASLNKLSFIVGDSIAIRLIVSGLEGNESVQAQAIFKFVGGANISDSPIELVQTSSNSGMYTASINSSILAASLAGKSSSDLLAKFNVQIDDKPYITTVPFFLNNSSARLENVSLSYQDADFLIIPLEYSVQKAGYYSVMGYLYDAATDRALLKLQTEGEMQQGNDRLLFRAHQRALRDTNSEGPYVLRIRESFLSALPGEGENTQTVVSQNEFDVQGFSFDSYQQSEYTNPEVQESIDFLRSISGKKDESN